MVKIGIIGGSGFDNPDFFKDFKELEVETQYGSISSKLKCGKIGSVDVVLLSRHGTKHTIPPTQVNYRANIFALKSIGCTHIIATTAVGSLRENIGRGDLVFPDQLIDFTRRRDVTFFEKFDANNPIHVSMSDPFSQELRNMFIKVSKESGLKYHESGTLITIEGSRFSTRAESKMFRMWGADIINMSVAPEAILSRELNIPYAVIAMSTDYDCWKEDEAPVTWDAVLEIFRQNVLKVIQLLVKVVEEFNPTKDLEIIKSKIRTVPNWPKEGVMFRDISTLIKDPEGFKLMINALIEKYKNVDFDIIAGIESRGFIVGSALAHNLGKGLVLIRKKGKLPSETIFENYDLEYGTASLEIHTDAILKNHKVLIVDDLLATGGTMIAASKLIERLDGEVIGCCCIVNLPELGGENILHKKYDFFSLVEFEGE
jgi:5'-methylthioadenosine phosphorylase